MWQGKYGSECLALGGTAFLMVLTSSTSSTLMKESGGALGPALQKINKSREMD